MKNLLAKFQQPLSTADNGVPVAGTQGQDRLIGGRRPWRRYVWLLAVLGVVGTGAAVVAFKPAGKTLRIPAERLTLGTVSQGPFEDYVALRTTVSPLVTAHLTTDQGGTVKEVLVEDGSVVKKGQVLIVISNPALQLQVASQRLAFEQARLKYERDLLDIQHTITTVEDDLARFKVLLDNGAIPARTYAQKQEELSYSRKLRDAIIESRRLDQASSTSSVANAGIEALTIRAPMDGQLTALDAEVGQAKSQGSVLGQVNSGDRFKLTAQVDEFYLGRIAAGQEASFTLDDRSYTAKVAKIYPQITNGTFKADFYFQGEPPAGVHVGQAIDVKVQLSRPDMAVLLPNGPFVQETGGNWIFVMMDGAHAVRRNIRLGRRNPSYIEVLSGIAPGEKAIVSSYAALESADQIELTKYGNNGD